MGRASSPTARCRLKGRTPKASRPRCITPTTSTIRPTRPFSRASSRRPARMATSMRCRALTRASCSRSGSPPCRATSRRVTRCSPPCRPPRSIRRAGRSASPRRTTWCRTSICARRRAGSIATSRSRMRRSPTRRWAAGPRRNLGSALSFLRPRGGGLGRESTWVRDSAAYSDPHPQTPPHRGEGSTPERVASPGACMDLATFAVQLLNGVQYGLVLFLVASGLTLVFGILGVINLAHGAFYMLGAYVAYWITLKTGSFFAALAGGVVIAFIAGLALETAFIKRLYGRDHLSQVLLSYGMILVLDEIRHILFGKD